MNSKICLLHVTSGSFLGMLFFSREPPGGGHGHPFAGSLTGDSDHIRHHSSPSLQALQGVPSRPQTPAGERLLPRGGGGARAQPAGRLLPVRWGEPSPADREAPPVGCTGKSTQRPRWYKNWSRSYELMQIKELYKITRSDILKLLCFNSALRERERVVLGQTADAAGGFLLNKLLTSEASLLLTTCFCFFSLCWSRVIARNLCQELLFNTVPSIVTRFTISE